MFGDPYFTILAVWGSQGHKRRDAECDPSMPGVTWTGRFILRSECPEREAQLWTRARTPEPVRQSRLFWQLGHGLLDLCFGVMLWMT